MGLFNNLIGKKTEKSKKPVKEAIVSEEPVVFQGNDNDLTSNLLKRIISEPENKYELQQEAGKIGKPALNALVTYLNSDSVNFRKAAAIGIEGIANNLKIIDLQGVISTTVVPLIEALKDDSPTVRLCVVNALRRIIHQYYMNTKHLDMLSSQLRQKINNIASPLASMLDEQTDDIRFYAAKILLDYCGVQNKDGFVWGDKNFAIKAKSVFVSGLDHESIEIQKLVADKLQWEDDEVLSKKAKQILSMGNTI